MISPIYDLATARADYPAWHGEPQRTLMLCSHPRSGSTLLGEALYATGLLGCPLEYFHRGFRPAFAERWQAPTIRSLIAAAKRNRTSPCGVFSAKLFWQDIEDMVEELEPSLCEALRESEVEPAAYRCLYTFLTSWFPQPAFIYLSRQDRVRQAISALVATCTRQWRAIPGQGRQHPAEEVAYDYERILGLIAFADHCHSNWRRFFEANALQPHILKYEDLLAEDSPAVRSLLNQLGYTGVQPARRMQRQVDSRSEQLLARFLREYQERSTGCF
jgi:trehalose 2-sulfotransferase